MEIKKYVRITVLGILFLWTVNVYSALSFDAVDDVVWVSSPMSSWFQNNKSLVTVEFWLYLDTVNRRNWMIDLESELVIGVDYEGGENNNQLRTYIEGTGMGGWYYSTGLTFAAGRWYHVAMVYNGSTRIHYVNSNVIGNKTGVSGVSLGQGVTQRMRFGSYTQTLAGKLSEIRFWSRALSQDEIRSNMYKSIPIERNLEGYWKCDDGNGSKLSEYTTNNFMTKITGASWVINNPPIMLDEEIEFEGKNIDYYNPLFWLVKWIESLWQNV